MSSAQSHALLLNADYAPLKVIDWERAITLLLEDTAELVENYAGRFVRSMTLAMPWPAVLRLKRFVKERSRMRFTRANVLARDGYQCGYCGVKPIDKKGKPRVEELSLDHVVPRAQSRGHQVKLPWSGKTVPVTCWENITTCCIDCNVKKADKTPQQAGMVLRVTPRPPTAADILRMTLYKRVIPDEWKQYLPKDSPWVNYWDEELAAD